MTLINTRNDADVVSPNPFFVGGPVPPEHFLGRTLELNVAFDQIASRSHLAIWGSGGMGKSSLLRFLASPQAWRGREQECRLSNAIIIYLNCTVINPFTPTGFWRELLSLMKNRSDVDATLQADIEQILQKAMVEKSDFCQVLRKIAEQKKFLVLLLDDYNAALHPNENYTETEMLAFLGEFRNLAVHFEEGQNLSTIVTSSRRLSELGPQLVLGGSPWYNHYLFHPLRAFEEDEVTALTSKMPSQWSLTPELYRGIRALADGHPALLQNALHLLFNIRRQGKKPNVEKFWMDFVGATQHFFAGTWRFSCQEEQMPLMLIALSHLDNRLPRQRRYNLSGLDSILSQRTRELLDMEERGVIRRQTEEGKQSYYFTSSVMEWWIIQEIENRRDEEELQKLEQVFFGVSRQQMHQIRDVLRQIWQNKDAIKSTVGWAGELAAFFA